mmetsp:Transcript_4845/g.20581  ORF Transcript_4845/g.20581 Transcript_4845/m.20581 type:complete len:224 (-) Transcript_4845:123-794(-)
MNKCPARFTESYTRVVSPFSVVSVPSVPSSSPPHAARSCSLHPNEWPEAKTGADAGKFSRARSLFQARANLRWHSSLIAPWSVPSSYGVATTAMPASSHSRDRNASYAMCGYEPSTAPPTKCTAPHARPLGTRTHDSSISSHPSPSRPPRFSRRSRSTSCRRERSSSAAPTVPSELGRKPSPSSSDARGTKRPRVPRGTRPDDAGTRARREEGRAATARGPGR